MKDKSLEMLDYSVSLKDLEKRRNGTDHGDYDSSDINDMIFKESADEHHVQFMSEQYPYTCDAVKINENGNYVTKEVQLENRHGDYSIIECKREYNDKGILIDESDDVITEIDKSDIPILSPYLTSSLEDLDDMDVGNNVRVTETYKYKSIVQRYAKLLFNKYTYLVWFREKEYVKRRAKFLHKSRKVINKSNLYDHYYKIYANDITIPLLYDMRGNDVFLLAKQYASAMTAIYLAFDTANKIALKEMGDMHTKAKNVDQLIDLIIIYMKNTRYASNINMCKNDDQRIKLILSNGLISMAFIDRVAETVGETINKIRGGDDGESFMRMVLTGISKRGWIEKMKKIVVRVPSLKDAIRASIIFKNPTELYEKNRRRMKNLFHKSIDTVFEDDKPFSRLGDNVNETYDELDKRTADFIKRMPDAKAQMLLEDKFYNNLANFRNMLVKELAGEKEGGRPKKVIKAELRLLDRIQKSILGITAWFHRYQMATMDAYIDGGKTVIPGIINIVLMVSDLVERKHDEVSSGSEKPKKTNEDMF